jgi:glycosyltransferase involved in cell wall biosynthesis
LEKTDSKKFVILLISPEAWGSNFVSKHHYAATLSKLGHKVYFLNPPSSGFKVSATKYDNLFVINYLPLFRGLRKLPFFLSAWLTFFELSRLEKRVGEQFEIVWNFETSRFFNLSKVSSDKIKISHIVDYTENFNLELASATADICLGTTDYINQEQKKYATNVHKLHHGVQISASECSLKLNFSKKINAAYLGNLSLKYIDWETIYQICFNHQEIGFYFIGPSGTSNLGTGAGAHPSFDKVKCLDNTYFPGPVPSEQVPDLLKKFDILLLVYHAARYPEQLASPHKLMEYLASGKVIVASYTDEYKDKRELLVMAGRNQGLPSLFSQVCSNLSQYNSEEKIKLRQSFALDNTYEHQINRVFSLYNHDEE